MKFLRNEQGQALVLTALSLTMLLGFVAFATDVGIIFRDRRELQTAADAAALAAATEANDGGTTAQIQAAAEAAAEANGFANVTLNANALPPSTAASGPVVTVNNPPIGGSHSGGGYVEVYVTEEYPTVLMGLFGSKNITVSARGEAGVPFPNSNCVWLGGTSGTDLEVHGNGSLDAQNCSVYINSTASNALWYHDSGSSVTASEIDIQGGYTGTYDPTQPVSNAAFEQDPLGNLEGPDPTASGTCGETITQTSWSTATKIDASGFGGVVCFDNTTTTVDISNLTLANGIFVFENGVKTSVGGNTTFSNATLDLYNGTYTQSTNYVLNITAPTTGPYNSVGLLVPPASNGKYNTTYACTGNPQLQVNFGSSNQTMDLYIYAPDAQLTLQDQGGGVSALGIVACSIPDDNSAITIQSYNLANPNTTPLRKVTLVE